MLKLLKLCCASSLSLVCLLSNVSAQSLAGSEWSPTELEGVAFEAETEVFLRFESDGRFFGNGGCNTIRGQFVTNQSAILFGPAAATMMACPEPIARMEYEFLRALDDVRAFERDGINLVFSNSAGDTVLRLLQRDAD